MKKLSIGLLMLVVGLVSCTPNQLSPIEVVDNEEKMAITQTLQWNIGAEPLSIDPQFNRTADGDHLINNLYEGLFRMKNDKVMPALCEVYEVSQEGRLYLFKLLETSWSDGSPLTAYDFEYAWLRALSPEKNNPNAYYFNLIQGASAYFKGDAPVEEVGIRAIDAQTLEVRLVSPYADFLELLTLSPFMPVKDLSVNEGGDTWFIATETLVTNGPFLLSEYNPGTSFVLDFNPNYHLAALVQLDTIIVNLIVDENAQIIAYKSGRLDVVEVHTPELVENIGLLNEVLKAESEPTNYLYLFNQGIKPLDDWRVRTALSLAVDRSSLLASTALISDEPAVRLIPNSILSDYAKKDLPLEVTYPIDPIAILHEEANDLLGAAGYKNGQGFPKLRLITQAGQMHGDVARLITYMWRYVLGVEVEIIQMIGSDYQRALLNGDFDIAKMEVVTNAPEPGLVLWQLHSESSANTIQWNSSEYDRVLQGMMKQNGYYRENLLYKAERLLIDRSVIMPLFFKNDVFLVNPMLKNWEKTPRGTWFFGRAYLLQ